MSSPIDNTNIPPPPTFSPPHHIQAIVNASIFLILYLILQISIIVFACRGWKIMQRNQRVLYVLVGVFVALQMLGVGAELIHNAAILSVVTESSQFPNSNLNSGNVSILASVSNLIAFLKLLQLQNLFILMSFIQNIFLTTLHRAGGLSKQVYLLLQIILNILTILLTLLSYAAFLTAFIMRIVQEASNIQLDRVLVEAFGKLGVSVYFFSLFVNTCIFVLISIRLFYVVKTRRSSSSQVKHTHAIFRILNQPLTKIVGLLFGMILSALCFCLGVLGLLVALADYNVLMVYYFFSDFGVLIFAIMVLMLYNPLTNASSSSEKQTIVTPKASPATREQQQQQPNNPSKNESHEVGVSSKV
ncbi:hypothetical protein C9374_004082 [Naegleria lovaniensis]|uniref:Uncharacterized protein n=1 Tax=Naegleria lovaniensis TaxID=51637 RepID=A0AA88GQE7_NAELO|nr:uncharacterized protein C9374_004082 [Naegleria lovaniensis]KAG2383411.1 hypothetical protein C9374_004082 [Naegleria lovaniensis]